MTTQQSNPLSDERNFRQKTLEEFIDQGDLKKTLRLKLDSAHQRSAVLEHVVFEAIQTGQCTLTDGDFSVQLIVK
jgi:Holliday junction resolvasome RuvABC ATP-dependent DNA helicase subunit